MQHAKQHFGGDLRKGILFALMDIWPMPPQLAARTNFCSWCPIDHEPVLPQIVRFFKESGAVPVAMSRFGEKELAQVDLDPLYVPHGVDTQVFRPYDKSEVDTGSLPKDAFLVGMVAANKGRPSRKCFSYAMQAFAIFRQTHKEAVLYLHTVVDPSHASGEDIMAIAAQLGLDESCLFIAPRYQLAHDPLSSTAMAQIYSCLDVLLNPSMGEGFGCPIMEAASCGVPAIVTNFTAMPEVASEYGWAVGCRPHWTAGNSWQAIPTVEEIVAALEACYSEPATERETRKQKLREHALNYDVDKVMEDHFLPTLRNVEDRFFGSKEDVELIVPGAV